MDMDPPITALLLATAAGLSTGIGSLLGFMVREPGGRFISFTLGFSAGVMVHVSFVELYPKGVDAVGFVTANAALLAGMCVYFLLDLLVPHDYIAQHDHPAGMDGPVETAAPLRRTGTLVALGIALHNVPEGMATFVGAMEDFHVGAAIALAIAIHNIPEGLAISAPVYAGSGSRGKAFLWSFLSGIAEIGGALGAAAFLLPVLTPSVMGMVLAGVAGIMVAISLDELMPVARSQGQEHMPILGVICGMAVMAASLALIAA